MTRPTTSSAAAGSAIFRIASAPARWLSRVRPDLGAALAVDAERATGSAGILIAVLALIAVGYPVLASISHAATVTTYAAPDWFGQSLRPVFDTVYTESLPFMLAAAGVGLFSPALGVLFLLVFIPADLIAAASTGYELTPLAQLQPWPAPIVARLVSYALLWILAVEIPIASRRWATTWASRHGRQASVLSLTGAMVVSVAALTLVWATAVPWLIQPVFTWTVASIVQPGAEVPLWSYWPVLVVGATVLAGVIGYWWASSGGRLIEPLPTRRRRALSAGAILVRQTVVALLLVLLLGGLISNLLEAVLLIAILVIAGPLLTPLLPRIPAPFGLARARPSIRWAAALVVGLVGSVIGLQVFIFIVSDINVYYSYTPHLVTLAVMAPIFRIVLEAGSASAPAMDGSGGME